MLAITKERTPSFSLIFFFFKRVLNKMHSKAFCVGGSDPSPAHPVSPTHAPKGCGIYLQYIRQSPSTCANSDQALPRIRVKLLSTEKYTDSSQDTRITVLHLHRLDPVVYRL